MNVLETFTSYFLSGVNLITPSQIDLWGKNLRALKNTQFVFKPTENWEGEGRSQKAPPPTSFSSLTLTNGGVSPKNFLTFTFNSFVTLV